MILRLRRRRSSLCLSTSVPVSSVPTFPLTRTSGVARMARVRCFPCPWTPSRDSRTSSTRTTCCGGNWRRSERWTDSRSSGRGGCRNRTTSQWSRDETGRGRGAVEKSSNSCGWRTKIWSSVCENSPTSWWSWSRNEKAFWWPSNCSKTTSPRQRDADSKPRVPLTSWDFRVFLS